MMGKAMNMEIDAQSTQLSNIQDKTSDVDGQLMNTNSRLNKMLDN
jgi:hypothetical protein